MGGDYRMPVYNSDASVAYCNNVWKSYVSYINQLN